MALVHMSPIEARVRWDARADRPTEVSWPGHHLRIADLDHVRDERSAFPVARGPRLTLVVRTTSGERASLVFDGRRGRWFLEALEDAA